MLVVGVLLIAPFWLKIYFNRVPYGTLYFKEDTKQILTPEDAPIKRVKNSAKLKVFALKNLKSGDTVSVSLTLAQLFPRVYKGRGSYSGKEVDVTILNDKGDLLYQKKMDLFYYQKETTATTIKQNSNIIINISSQDGIAEYISPIRISVERDGKELFTYLEKITRYTYLIDTGNWLTPLVLIGIALAIFGYTVIVKALYRIGGVYNPVNPEQNRPPE